MTDSEIVIQALQIITPILAAAVSVFAIYRSTQEKGNKEARNEAIVGMRLDSMGTILEEIKKSQDELLSGYHSNESRITRIEDHISSHSMEINELKSRVSRLEEKC